MTALTILALLGLATAALLLRTVLIISGWSEASPLASTVPIAVLPPAATEWACNLAMLPVLFDA